MRTIFITPLLWKRVDRAMRRRNEGQALVLVALTAIGMVAMVGLAIDGGLAFMEAQKIQRAADAAALAGAVWMPSLKPIADARGELAAQANGFDAVNHGTTTQGTSSTDQTGNTVYYVGSSTNVPTQYQATVGHVAHRWFLGIIGFGNFYIQRSAIAQYSSLPKLGSSDNYLGDSVLFNEHDRLDINGINALLQKYYNNSSITCSKGSGYDQSWQGGSGDPAPAWLHYYCGLYLHLLYQSCNLRSGGPNSTSTLPCLGTFWLNIFSPDIFTDNGDGYTPGMVGDDAIDTGRPGNDPYPTGTFVNSDHNRNNGSALNECTRQLTDAESWFDSLVDSNGSGSCPQTSGSNYSAANPPDVNFNFQPDAPTVNGANPRNFGYEVAIQVAPDAIVSDSTLSGSNVGSHTALNVSIYGAGGAAVGNDITFGPPQQYNTNYSWSGGANGTSNDFYGGAISQPSYENNPAARIATTSGNGAVNFTKGRVAQTQSGGTAFTPAEHVPIDRDSVTRFMLFLPPTAPGTPTTWATKGAPVHAINASYRIDDNFTTDAGGNATGTALVTPDLNWFPADYISTDIAQPVTNTMQVNGGGQQCNAENSNNDQSGTNYPNVSYFDSGTHKDCSGNSNNGTAGWKQYCYAVDPEWLNPNGTSSRLATAGNALTKDYSIMYVCPPHGSGTNYTPADRYWNQLYGSPSASIIVPVPISGTVGGGPFTTYSSVTNTVETFPQTMYFTGTYAYGNNVLTTTKVYNDLYTTVDPSQACRSLGDLYWGNDRIPFNMRGADWTSQVITSGGTIYNSNATKIANQLLLTQYFSYHGERCSWDFDSAFQGSSNGPDFNPIRPGSTMNGCYPGANGISSQTPDAGLLLDSPFITSFAVYNSGVDTIWQQKGGGAPFANVACYEPFFHITNWHWEGTSEVWNGSPSATTTDAYQKTPWLVGGTYLLHVQVYGGMGQHRYAIKAEYENPAAVQLPLAGTNTMETQNYSVPSVYGIGNFSIYTNAKVSGKANDVIFDLASIPSQNHDFTAILEMWDVGDVGSNLNIGLLKPSGYGKGYGYQYQSGGSTNFIDPTNNDGLDSLVSRAITITQVNLYPYNNAISANSVKTYGASSNFTQTTGTLGTGMLNGEWADIVFQLPNANYYTQIAATCASHDIPDNDCYYFQVDYQLIPKSGGDELQYANDTTTWQLYIQNQPVHLVS